tara:strand:- start:2225 stop:2695 length:471 start_codon:yes stop_codon:yes gene_type:complete
MDKRFYFFGALTLAAGLTVSALQGCDLKTMVSVSVPPEARAALNIPKDEKITYAESAAVFGQWESFVERVTADLSEGIQGAEERYALLQSVTDTGLNALSAEASSFPGGALLVGALGGLGGLFLNKPGTKKKMRQAVQGGFQKGVQVAQGQAEGDK